MKNSNTRAVAMRLAPFLLALIVSWSLTQINSIYVNRQSVFIGAAHDGKITRMRVIYLLGIDINTPACKPRLCFTPIVAATLGGHPDAIQFLLDRGADINNSGRFGKTALMIAAYYGHDESVELLLSRGADVNAQTKDGDTALSFARLRDQQTTIDLLLRAGAKENP